MSLELSRCLRRELWVPIAWKVLWMVAEDFNLTVFRSKVHEYNLKLKLYPLPLTDLFWNPVFSLLRRSFCQKNYSIYDCFNHTKMKRVGSRVSYPDPHGSALIWFAGSGFWSRGAKMAHKKKVKKVKKFHVSCFKCWMFSFGGWRLFL